MGKKMMNATSRNSVGGTDGPKVHYQKTVGLESLLGMPPMGNLDFAVEDKVARELGKLSSFNEFDVFELERLTNGHALQFVSAAVMRNWNLCSSFNFVVPRVQ